MSYGMLNPRMIRLESLMWIAGVPGGRDPHSERKAKAYGIKVARAWKHYGLDS
jgi:hypothetical protein